MPRRCTPTTSGSRLRSSSRTASAEPASSGDASQPRPGSNPEACSATVADAETFGVISSPPEFAWPKALERKTKIVDGLVKGLTGTLKARDVDIIDGRGRVCRPRKVEVTAEDGSPSHSRPRRSSLPQDLLPRRFPGTTSTASASSAPTTPSTGTNSPDRLPSSVAA